MTKPAGDTRVVIEHPDGRQYEVSRDAFKDIYEDQGFAITHNADMTIAPEVLEERAKAEKAAAKAAEDDAPKASNKKAAAKEHAAKAAPTEPTVAYQEANAVTAAAQPASVTITTDAGAANGTGQSAPQG